MPKQTKQDLSCLDVPDFLKVKKAAPEQRQRCITIRRQYIMPTKLQMAAAGALTGLAMGIAFALAAWAICQIL